MSKADLLRALPEDERRARIATLSPQEAFILLYDWRFWARPNQLIPTGSWRVWLILAGRGFGKTRCGAETVRKWVKTNAIVNIAGPTAADARDVMVEGESGILAVCPKTERPTYIKSDRKLRWPNGAISLIFSADEPERFRGPQAMKLWADELCLTVGTLIATVDGSKPIEDVRAGDLVQTRNGLRRVARQWMSALDAEIWELRTSDGRVLAGTAGHPVWTDEFGFLPLSAIPHGATLNIWEQELSNGAVSAGITIATTTAIDAESCYTAKNSSTPTDLFPVMSMSITSMATSSTTSFPTWSRCAAVRTFKNMGRAASWLGRRKSDLRQLLGRGLQKALALCHVSGAARCSQARGSALDSAVITAELPSDASVAQRGESAKSGPDALQSRAKFAASFSGQTIRGREHAHSNAAISFVSSVAKLAIRAAVYNLEVEGAHEYFANGILTHNCAWRYPEAWDQAMFGLRLGTDPQAMVTTTPKPTALIKALVKSPSTFVTRGTTYDNRSNLAAGFLMEIVSKYEGTRLGRQELNAEILEDNPGALWTRKAIDDHRMEKLPELRRIVVGVDPAVSAKEDSDLTGIVVCGRDGQSPPHFYVIDDRSLIASPKQWAEAVSSAYRQHRADRVVAEVNNGGDLVEMNLRTVNADVSFTAVHASRGKIVRAEPIAAMYEQGRVHHIGSFAQLEDEMTDFNPLTSSKSPDRMDALVWALTELSSGAGGISGFYADRAKQRAQPKALPKPVEMPKPREWSEAIRTIAMGISADADGDELREWIAYCEAQGNKERATFAQNELERRS